MRIMAALFLQTAHKERDNDPFWLDYSEDPSGSMNAERGVIQSRNSSEPGRGNATALVVHVLANRASRQKQKRAHACCSKWRFITYGPKIRTNTNVANYVIVKC